jgi:hypothetical protein
VDTTNRVKDTSQQEQNLHRPSRVL